MDVKARVTWRYSWLGSGLGLEWESVVFRIRFRYWDRDQGCNSISGAGLDSGLNG